MAKQDAIYARLRSVYREHSAMALAAERFLNEARLDPTILRETLRLGDVIRASDSLAGTYIIRLFAEFETGLRSYWVTRRSTQPKTVDLLQGITALRGVPGDVHLKTQEVRKYRNSLVHERNEAIPAISIEEVRRALGGFIARLPLDW